MGLRADDGPTYVDLRDQIVRIAQWWAFPGAYQPTADELIDFFQGAKTEQYPSLTEAERSLKTLNTGVYVGGSVKQWCGIFACSVLASVGLNVRWTLNGGKMLGSVMFVPGFSGMLPGDVAIIARAQHHFIITDVDYDSGTFHSVDGNTSGQKIQSKTKSLKNPAEAPYGYYRVSF
jgi:hypothetical protein